MPSAQPSFAGWVSTVSATTTVTEAIEQDVLDGYTADLAAYYGVELSDITPTTVYAASGSMQLSTPITASESDVIDAIESSIAETLGVHPQDVTVTVDLDTGVVEFSVSSESFTDAAGSQFNLENDQTRDAIIAGIGSVVDVEEYVVDPSVSATVEWTIDADSASNDITQAAWQSEQLLSDFDVTFESNIRHSIQYKPCFFTPSMDQVEKLKVSIVHRKSV